MTGLRDNHQLRAHNFGHLDGVFCCHYLVGIAGDYEGGDGYLCKPLANSPVSRGFIKLPERSLPTDNFKRRGVALEGFLGNGALVEVAGIEDFEAASGNC